MLWAKLKHGYKMFSRIFNLVLALLTTSFAITDLLAFPPTFGLVLFSIIGPCWLVGAIGLLFQRRFALYLSFLGATTLFSGSLAMLASGLVLLTVSENPAADPTGNGEIL
jgi:hypothetical protein